MKVAIIAFGKHDGLTLDLKVLPGTGDSIQLDDMVYRVHKILHKVDVEQGAQSIAIVLGDPSA